MAQIFVESIFEKHVDGIELISDDENDKNILQVKIQKEFKVTPHYLEVYDYDEETGYHMGVYICLGQPIHAANKDDAIIFEDNLKTFQAIHEYMENNESILVFLAEGKHKIKRKAEQIACEKCINFLNH